MFKRDPLADLPTERQAEDARRRAQERQSLAQERQAPPSRSWFRTLGGPMTIVAIPLLIASGALYWGMQDLVAEANLSFEAGARAWISPVAAGLPTPIENGKPITIGLRYTNVGKAPASDVNIHYALHVFPNDAMDNGKAMATIASSDICAGVEPVKGAEVVYPTSGIARLVLAINPADPKTGKHVALYDTYMAGNQTLAAQFCVAYKTLGATHKSAFCYFYRPGVSEGASLNQCNQGNYAD